MCVQTRNRAFPSRCARVTSYDPVLTATAAGCEVFVTRSSRPAPFPEIRAFYAERVTISNDLAPRVQDVDSAESSWVTVCRFAELEPFWGEAALLGDTQLALFLLPDAVVHAVSNRDPIAGSFVMSRGIVGSRGDRATIASPLNKQVYDLETGECLSAEGPGLAVFPVRISAGMVEVGTVEVGTVELAQIGASA